MGLGLGMAAGALGDSLFSIGKYLYQQQRDDEEKARQAVEQQRLDAELYYRTGYMRGNGPAPSAPSAPLKGAVSSSPIPGPTPRAPVAQDFFGSYAPGQGPGQVPVPKLLAPSVGPDVSAPIAPPPAAQRQTQAPVGRPAPPGFMKAGLGAVEQARSESDADQRNAALAEALNSQEFAKLPPEQQQAVISSPTLFRSFVASNQARERHATAEALRAAIGVGNSPTQITPGVSDEETILQSHQIREQGAKVALKAMPSGGTRPRSAGNPAGEKPLTATEQKGVAAIRARLKDRWTTVTPPDNPNDPATTVTLIPSNVRLPGETEDDALDRLSYLAAARNNLIAADKVPVRFRQTAQPASGGGTGRRNGSAKRVITQDQKDYLVARGTWDANLYEVR